MVKQLLSRLKRKFDRTPDNYYCTFCGTPVPKIVVQAYTKACTTDWRYCPACGEEWEND